MGAKSAHPLYKWIFLCRIGKAILLGDSQERHAAEFKGRSCNRGKHPCSVKAIDGYILRMLTESKYELAIAADGDPEGPITSGVG